MSKVRVRHYYSTKNGRLVATIATRQEGDLIQVAASVCHVRDNPSKAIGRNIAIGRLDAGKNVVTMSADEYHERAETGTILLDFVNSYAIEKNPYLAAGIAVRLPRSYRVAA